MQEAWALREGTDVRLAVTVDGDEQSFASRVAQVSDWLLSVHAPFVGDVPLAVPKNTPIVVALANGFGPGVAAPAWAQTSPPCFPGVVVASRQDPRAVWVLTQLETVTQTRRRYPRCEAALPVRFRVVEDRQERLAPRGSGTTVNLSAGGLLMETSLPLSEGATLQAELELPGGREVEVVARVVRVEAHDDGPGCWAALEYLVIDETLRLKILSFVVAANKTVVRPTS